MKVRLCLLLLCLLSLSACTKPDPNLVRIAGGMFVAGSTTLQRMDNYEREVRVADFYLDRFEVTNEQYARCVDANACRKQGSRLPLFAEPDQPAVMVDWDQAVSYCEWRGMRLPSENEWERAARGPQNSLYPWGDANVHDAANGGGAPAYERSGHIYRFTSPVGVFTRDVSGFGIYDMAGNVSEWTADTFSPRPDSTSQSPDPNQRVVKGGFFYAEPGQLTGAWREPNVGTNQSIRIGFRCAKNAD